MSIIDDLFSEGIVPYPTSFPDETDVMEAINNDVFNAAELSTPTEATTEDVENAINSDVFNSAEIIGASNTEISDIEQSVALGTGVSGATSQKNSIDRNSNEGWRSVSYAYGLANSQFRPKLKFMFYVDFAFKSEFSQMATSEWGKNMAFMAKAVDRPKATIEYEDINQYNFKTKVIKNVKNEDVSITFYDDSSNFVVDFFRFVLSLLHPVTRRANTFNSDLDTGNLSMTESHGMVFSADTFNTSDYSHRGTIETDNGQIFQTIKVTQTFIVPTGDGAARQISYLYVNPMISSIEMNELSSEDTSNTCEVTIKFSYDAVIIPNGEELQNPRNPMPDVGEIKSDFQTGQLSGSMGGFNQNSAAFNLQKSLDELLSNAPSSGGAALSSMIKGLPSNINLSTISSLLPRNSQVFNQRSNNAISILSREIPAIGRVNTRINTQINNKLSNNTVNTQINRVNRVAVTGKALNDVLTAGSDFFGMF